MKKISLAILLFTACVPLLRAEIAVIVNSDNPTKALTPEQVQDIYMGRKRSFPDGKMALPLDQAQLRPLFYQKLTQRPIEQINAYWARIMFSGQASPPAIMSNDAAVIEAIKDNPGAIGYITKDKVDNKMKTLLVIE